MREYKQLLLANKAWATELLEEKTDFFQRQTVGQKPDFLWIGCSDSRVTPEQMTMTPGACSCTGISRTSSMTTT